MNKQEIKNKLSEMGLTVESKFVPFSQSRNKAEKNPSLNWIVTLKKNGKVVLSTDYMAGCAHCPSYKQMDNTSYTRRLVNLECEKGFKVNWLDSLDCPQITKKEILPDSADVIYSLMLDSEVFGQDFESWCGDFGYDEDSRKAEKMFHDCMKIANKFVASIGTDGIEALHEIYQDY